MPIPTPMKGEGKDSFISRCIEQLSKADPNRKGDQVQAICFDNWDKKSPKKKNYKVLNRGQRQDRS